MTIYSAIGNWYRIFSSRICQSLYVVKSKAQSERCVPYCAMDNYRYLIANYYMRWHCNIKGLSWDGGQADFFQKTSAPPPLMTTYRMSLISVVSISLDSTFERLQKKLQLGFFSKSSNITSERRGSHFTELVELFRNSTSIYDSTDCVLANQPVLPNWTVLLFTYFLDLLYNM